MVVSIQPGSWPLRGGLVAPALEECCVVSGPRAEGTDSTSGRGVRERCELLLHLPSLCQESGM